MLRAMVFIDFENFSIAKYKYYKQLSTENSINGTEVIVPNPKISFVELSWKLVKMLPQAHTLMKTFLFVPKPDEFLMQDPHRLSAYNWMESLKSQNLLTVIEGRHIARPVDGLTYQDMLIDDRTTYYVEEKGTDVNLSTHLLTKGFLNAYDTAIVVSADTDYITVMDVLNTLGKNVVVAGVVNQNLAAFQQHTDKQLRLADNVFQRCIL